MILPTMLRATRLYVSSGLGAGAEVTMAPEQAHYLRTVLRKQTGDVIHLFNGRDGEFDAEIAELGKNRGTFRIGECRVQQPETADLWLFFAPVKKAQTDFIVQKATELGVSRLQPVFTQFTQSERVRVDRMRANAIEAAEQTERLDIPQIEDPIALDALLDGWTNGAVEDGTAGRTLYLCAESGGATPLAEVASSARERGGPAAFLTGPEGGFSQSELDRMRALPFIRPVGLGPRVLRAETAVVAALAVWQSIAGDGRDRPPERE